MSGKRRKKNLPARIVEQAGVPKDRVIGLSIERKGLFYLLTLDGVGFVSSEDEDMAVAEEFLMIGIVFRNII